MPAPRLIDAAILDKAIADTLESEEKIVLWHDPDTASQLKLITCKSRTAAFRESQHDASRSDRWPQARLYQGLTRANDQESIQDGETISALVFILDAGNVVPSTGVPLFFWKNGLSLHVEAAGGRVDGAIKLASWEDLFQQLALKDLTCDFAEPRELDSETSRVPFGKRFRRIDAPWLKALQRLDRPWWMSRWCPVSWVVGEELGG